MDNKLISGLLNPVRMRILQICLKHDTITTRQIAEMMSDVPIASLYRHINKLSQEHILEVIEENKIRGTIEKVYKLKTNPLTLIHQSVEQGGKEELFNMFYTFVMSMLSDFQGYIDQDSYHLIEDRVGFRSFALYLSDAEVDEFLKNYRLLIEEAQEKEQSAERRLRKLSLIMMPSHDHNK